MVGMIVLQIVLIALDAVFACAEIAILSVNEAKLAKMAEEGNKKAARLLKLSVDPAKFLATIQVAITLSGFLGSAFAADNFSDILVNWLLQFDIGIPESAMRTGSVVLITLILSYFTLIFGELVPKRVAMKKTEAIALGLSGLISGISVLFRPIVWFLSVSTNGVLRLLGINPADVGEKVSEEEIRLMVDAGSESGVIDDTEKEFIHNVFEFDDLNAEEIATHRTEIDMLWMEDPVEKWAEIIHETRHTLYPVCGQSQDDVIGILDAKDYFRLKDHSKEKILEIAVNPAYFVPASIKADVLFHNMKNAGHKLAVVVDEYGGMIGIVTMTDLVEELVGEFAMDADDPTEHVPQIEQSGEGRWHIIGNLELEKLSKATGLALENSEFDTFTGFVFNELKMIPDDGEQDLQLVLPEFTVHILRIEEHMVAEAEVILTPTATAPEEA